MAIEIESSKIRKPKHRQYKGNKRQANQEIMISTCMGVKYLSANNDAVAWESSVQLQLDLELNIDPPP